MNHMTLLRRLFVALVLGVTVTFGAARWSGRASALHPVQHTLAGDTNPPIPPPNSPSP